MRPAHTEQRQSPLLSIIVPAYKVERTLNRCLESIVSQDFTQWEMFLVDDGSPDETPALCDRWATGDDRIRVIHQANKGLSGARNAGLERASGEFVAFVDSDDMLAPHTLQRVMDTTEGHPDCDILEFSYRKTWDDGTSADFALPCREYTSPEEYWLEGEAYRHAYAWNKIYRRTLFSEVRFPEGVLFEDMHTLPRLLQRAHSVVTTDAGTYLYYQNPQGITQMATATEWGMLLDHHLKAWQWLSSPGPPKQSQRVRMSKYYMHLVDIQLYYSALSGQRPKLPAYSASWQGCPTMASRLKLLLLKTLGIRTLCRCYSLFYKLKRHDH